MRTRVNGLLLIVNNIPNCWCAVIRTLALVAAAAAISYGQAFQGITTTEDGSVLYFSSPTRQRGTDQSYYPKIFRWDTASGFRVVAEQRDRGEFNGCSYSNFYEFVSPSV